MDVAEANQLIKHIVEKQEDYAYWTDYLKASEFRFNQTKHGEYDENAKKLIKLRKEKADSFIAKYKGHLKDIICRMMDAAEFADEVGGLTKDEYTRMVSWMPDFENMKSYFEKLRFEAYAGRDGIMMRDDFKRMLDAFVEQSV